MIDLLDTIESWLEEGQRVALATVIKTWGSSPRQAGAGMAISEDGRIAGSVSGGCVEGAVAAEALEVIQTGRTARLHFGVADAEAWSVGLSCGGEIEVFIRTVSRQSLEPWRVLLAGEGSGALALVLEGDPGLVGREFAENDLSQPEVSGIPVSAAEGIKAGFSTVHREHRSAELQVSSDLVQEAFFYYYQPAPELILVGGVHIAIPLAKQAQTLGYEVTVIDPRRLFGSEERFPEIRQLIPAWPKEAFSQIELGESSAVVMLTHDPKIDDPALQIALDSPAFYIGALGSKKTHQKRLGRLIDLGIPKSLLDRIHAPVGLDLGADNPQEIALSILAEVLQVWRKGGRAND